MEPTRRTVLVTAAAALAGACTGDRDGTPAPVDPDVALSTAAVTREQQLVAAYDEVLAAVPALTPRLAPLRAEHLEHLTALHATVPTATPTSAPAPRTPAQALQRLAGLERAAAAAHAQAAVTASRALAPVLASLAASESAHLVVL